MLRVRADAVHWLEIEGEVVALQTDRGEYLSINRSGAILWAALLEGATRDQLADALVSSFGVAREAALADVQRFVADLETLGVVER